MSLYYEDAGLRLLHGSNKDILPTLSDESYDSIVTDPPYELGFMGKSWDSSGIAYDVDLWRECLRVLKPGGYLLAFGGTRTWHRIAVAIEDAGFEIRDSIAWMYGSGFPKSMNVAKAIDKARTDHDEIEIVRSFLDAVRRDRGLDLKAINQHFGFADNGGGLASTWTTNRTSKAIPTWEQWLNLKEWLGFGDEVDELVQQLEETRLGGTEAWNARPALESASRPGMATSWANGIGWSGKDARGGSAVRDEAKAWEGWGTALKPAFEPIVVARKPLSGTVAANVLAYGTGALNIDACRVEFKSDADKAAAAPQGRATARVGALAGKAQEWVSATTSTTEPSTTALMTDSSATSMEPESAPSAPGTVRTEFTPKQSDAGRFPANVLLDGSQAAALDEQTGVLTSGKMLAGTKPKGERKTYGQDAAAGYETTRDTPGDSGGASRFFPIFRYEAKAPSSERPEVDGTVHATVKPLALMRWLVRLVTRPGGRVLDPFAGSGTTGEAALLEGMEVDLIELEADHLPLILQRVRKPLQPSMFGDWEGDVA
jgi:DNA modification methylase